MAAGHAAALAIEREDQPPHGCVVVARGQIDLGSSRRLSEALLRAIDDGLTNVVVDLKDVNFIDSTGLGVIIGVGKRLRRVGGSLTVLSSDETIRKVFELAGVQPSG